MMYLTHPPEQGLNLEDIFGNPITGNNVGIKYNDEKNVLQMSNAKTQYGAIWGKNQIDLNYPFRTSFWVYLGNQQGVAADGMTFMMQTIGSNHLGFNGGDLGALKPDITSPSNGSGYLILEFDTYYNGNGRDSKNPDQKIILPSWDLEMILTLIINHFMKTYQMGNGEKWHLIMYLMVDLKEH
ncbi:lectin-like domain-containing protein [Melissococcus plutonius]|uniref:lectin-like domain-containing protein n=1 Tax=Melissococcus plutonius TaxID=33970 RepID=UPI00130538C3|nr:hypothetical protein [Melissococcus plutonius]